MRKRIVIVAVVVGFIFVIGAFWSALSDSVKDISNQQPYTSVLNKTWYTQRTCTLAKNLPAFVIKEDYFLTEQETLFEGVEKVSEIPILSPIIFTKAYRRKGAVSGAVTSILIGKITVNEKSYTFEYKWGEERFGVASSDNEWFYEKGIWEK